ncbi:FAD-binding oxidoreductase [Candidatus Bathyarchaeota archaeon]|jgi:FAD-dependent oxidoreductase domain-containing protein 1|nr:FAD-binding oxidoreductase [Candidatus Bathyarchaeota archaeon]MBT4320780.1 FAD-binding oxidoreductase [Candidatus Bathyarchaeota archaeon]MBT4422958.1 FAD-binding oxidoreductase [Candidatus Bathyarchaeota archaeon]MBT5642335.1 FAD-binding oxidoreductase [Candidatus Bathyarchaeota archaeon]MBT6605066.1 FAD-binding oxidoreductase [Candidatus Bathyarchaeota archaeon]
MECDTLVIGAGIMGLSTAYYMKKRDPSKKIVVIDKYSGPAQGNSAKSEGGFRNIFTSETNYLLADSSIDYFFHMEELGHKLKMESIGYLWLFSEEQYEKIRPAVEGLKERGVELEVYNREEIEAKVPSLMTDFGDDEEAEMLGLKNVDYGVYGRKCGSLDADALVRAYEAEFLKLGGEVKYNTEATELIVKPEMELEIPGEPFVWQEKVISGVKTSDDEITAGTTVVACGVWAHQLMDPVGLDSFQRPKKRQLFAFKDPKLEPVMRTEGLNHENALPLIVLPTAGIFLKAELSEGSIWLGCADTFPRKFELEEDPQAEDDYYTNNIYHALVMYFGEFEDVRPMNSWAGQYAINSFDETPVIYGEKGFVYVGCGSGSGIMKGDAIGRVADALCAGEAEVELHGGRKLSVAKLGIKNRAVEHEEFVI